MASWVELAPHHPDLCFGHRADAKGLRPPWLSCWFGEADTAPGPNTEGPKKPQWRSCGRMRKHQICTKSFLWSAGPHKRIKFVNTLWVWSSGGIQTAGYTSSFSSCCVKLDPELNQNSFSQSLVRTEPQSHQPDSVLLWSTANGLINSSLSWVSFCFAFHLHLVSKCFKHTSCGNKQIRYITMEKQVYCLYPYIYSTGDNFLLWHIIVTLISNRENTDT